jgi:predicted RNA binding protein YcfA (HicA-like mRNA interferase family)
MQKATVSETLKITVPAHSPIKRSTLSHILKQARLATDDFLKLLQ